MKNKAVELTKEKRSKVAGGKYRGPIIGICGYPPNIKGKRGGEIKKGEKCTKPSWRAGDCCTNCEFA